MSPRPAAAPPLLAAALLLACSTVDPPDTGRPCGSQSECVAPENCSRQFSEVCEAQQCKPLGKLSYQDLSIGLRQVLLQSPKSFRAWVLHPTNPDGSKVTCDAASHLPALGGAPVAEVSMLVNPGKVNLAGPLNEQNIRSLGVGDTAMSAIFLPGPGCVVYIEVYGSAIQACTFGPEGAPLGRACLENAPYTASADGGGAPVVLSISRI